MGATCCAFQPRSRDAAMRYCEKSGEWSKTSLTCAGFPESINNLKEARQIIEEWRIDYNTTSPHSSLNGLTPSEFAARPDQGHTGLSL
jgi:transposase InsO family protein